MNKIQWSYPLLGLFALVAGTLGAVYYTRYRQDQHKVQIQSEIAGIRTYSEAHWLRYGYYILAPDSCTAPKSGAWAKLGYAVPPPDLGCFRIESPDQAFAKAETAPTMQVVAVSKRDGLMAVEGYNDSRPKWTKLQ
jgi:hypothetical protein